MLRHPGAVDLEASPGPDPEDGSGPSRWRSFMVRHAALIGGGVVAAPLLVGAAVMLTRSGYAPYADLPLIELTVRDVGRQPVLIGAYSRFGWFHPGPLMFYVLAVPYRLFGSQAVSLPAAAAVVNAGWIWTAAWTARRRAGLAGLALVMAGTAWLVRTLGPDVWADAWNPSVAVLPFLVFILACWSLAAGDDVGAVVATVAGSFCVQSHAGYLPLVGLVGALAVASRLVLVVTRRGQPGVGAVPPPGGGRTLSTGWALGVTLGVGLVLWLPALIEQVTHDPGNLRQIVAYSRAMQPVLGVGDGVRLMSFELGWAPTWLTGELEPGWLGLLDVSRPPFPVGAVLLVVAGAAAAWRREGDALRLVVLAGGAVVAAVIAVSRFTDGILPYLTRWSAVVGLVSALAVVWTAARLVRPYLSAGARRGALAAVSVLGLLATGANMAAAVTIEPHDRDRGVPILEMSDAAQPHLDPSRPVVVQLADPSGGVEAMWTANGVADELDRRGFDVRVRATDTVYQWRADPTGATQTVAVRRMVDDVPEDWRGEAPLARSGDYAVWVAPYPP